MDKQQRKALLAEARKIKTYMGIVRIANTQNGKVFIAAFPNLKNKWLTIRMQLDLGRYANAALQADWKQYGESAFTYEVLEEHDATDITDMKWELEQMLKPWLERLSPYGERGYHREAKG